MIENPPFYKDDQGNPIERNSSIKDFGVLIEDNGKLDLHLQDKISWAFQMSR